MRWIGAMLLLGLAACTQAAPAPCNPPLVIDSTGACVSPERAAEQFRRR